MALLEIRDMTKFFGGLTAVMDLRMDVHSRQIFGLIGPNGAGKSTALNMIGGTLLPSHGQIILNGEEITKLSSHRRARRGVARVFQENLLFSNFTVLDNVRIGCHLQTKIDPVSIFLPSRASRRQENAIKEKAEQILQDLGLEPYADELAVNLPHGRQRMLSVAIALATQPQLLLLDEPVTGMNVEEVEVMLAMIQTLRDEKGITCIIIEHNLRAVMGLCDKVAVLNFGIKIAEGTPREIVENPAVTEAYLGTEENVA
jgi:branched-chain amino acid transport system ATP-binding protein